MRTTLTIDDDVLAAVKHLAERERKTLGEVISALARQGLTKSHPTPRPVRNGVPLLPTQQAGTAVTLERVNQLRDKQP
jgi:Ribbon-helix-helix protein, copG family